jgi:AcrR family transcriptional regulator
VARAAEQRTDRRAQIARALYDCISKQGYANTSLRDIAARAGMSPSHVGYYFDDQAAILEYYVLGLCERIVGSFPDLREPDPQRLIDAVASFCFGEGQLNSDFLGVVQEISGLAVHDPRLHEIKASHAEAWRRYLEEFFERVSPVSGMKPREAAWLAHALIVGFDTNSLFDRTLPREAAHALFRDTLRALTGTESGAAPRSTKRTHSARRAKGRR